MLTSGRLTQFPLLCLQSFKGQLIAPWPSKTPLPFNTMLSISKKEIQSGLTYSDKSVVALRVPITSTVMGLGLVHGPANIVWLVRKIPSGNKSVAGVVLFLHASIHAALNACTI